MTKISTANIKPTKTEQWLAKRSHSQRDLWEKELQQRVSPPCKRPAASATLR